MSIFKKLPDPNNVGSSEYRAIYDCINDAEGADDDMVVSMLQEFAGHALGMLKTIGKPLQLEVASVDGNATLSCNGLELSLFNVVQMNSTAKKQHVLTYRDVSIYRTVTDFKRMVLSYRWLSPIPNTDHESEPAFDVCDLPEPPKGYAPEGVNQKDADHLALALAIDLGNLSEEGYDEKWRLVSSHEFLENGDQRAQEGKWKPISVLSVGECALRRFTYRRKIK